jgi:hypothetical protein
MVGGRQSKAVQWWFGGFSVVSNRIICILLGGGFRGF